MVTETRRLSVSQCRAVVRRQEGEAILCRAVRSTTRCHHGQIRQMAVLLPGRADNVFRPSRTGGETLERMAQNGTFLQAFAEPQARIRNTYF